MLQEGASPTPVYPSQSKKQPLPSTNSGPWERGGDGPGFPYHPVAAASGTEGVSTLELPSYHFFVPFQHFKSWVGLLGGLAFLGGWGRKAWANRLERQLCGTVWV